MTAAQRLREQGLQQGREQTSRTLLLRLVQQRFGSELEPAVEQRLRSASAEQAETWALRVLSATSVADLFVE